MRNILLRLLPIIGLGASAILLIDYLNPTMLFCDPNSGCDVVKHSVYSHLLGIPTPVFGVAFFAAALGLALVPHKRARQLLLAMSGIGLGAGLGFMALQAFVIHAICKYCMVVDSSAVLFFVVAFASRNLDLEDDLTAPTRFGFAVVGLLALGAPFALKHVIATEPQPDPMANAPTPELVLKAQQPGIVTIVEFVDFECPYCRRLHATLESLLKEPGYTGKVRIVRKEHPLTSMHPHAMTAARAECCAETFDRGDEMAEALYTAPPEDLTKEGCEALAVKLGIDAEKWRACLASDKPNDEIISDQKDAQAAGVGEEAPVFWVGKQRIRGAQPADVIRDAINRAM